MTPKARREIWLKLLHSNHPEIVIGPRSALLSPLNNLGLIIIDEAHEPTYFQDQTQNIIHFASLVLLPKSFKFPAFSALLPL